MAACLACIRAYQVSLGQLVGGRCRFHPSCSNYAIDAYRLHGVWRGTALTVQRLARCHPWGGSGVDPVPGMEPPTPEGTEISEHDRVPPAGS